MINEWLCADESDWHEGVARRIAQCLRNAIDTRGTALLAVSGGRSPIGMFARLRTLELDWSRVVVTLADERWVPADHPDSNAALVRRHLLQGLAQAAQFLPLYNTADDPHAGQPACEAALAALPLPFDCVVLGMGEDGHTASLFPQAPELAQAIATDTPGALCCAITPGTAPHLRMTLTLHALLQQNRQLILAISGRSKREVYEQARAEETPTLPVSLLLHQDECPIDVWIEG